MPNPADVIAKLHIHFQRGMDEATMRDVSVTDFTPHSISGHCHLREQYRTFRIFDIRHCHDTATGEVVENDNLPAYLDRLYKKTGIREILLLAGFPIPKSQIDGRVDGRAIGRPVWP